MQKTFVNKPLISPLIIKKSSDNTSIETDLEVPDGFGQLPIDILEKKDEILIATPIAGVNMDKTEIVITNDVLTIKGERRPDFEDFGFKEKDLYVNECFWGKFSRSVILPAQVDSSLIEATERDHVLYVRIPKRNRITMRIVKIKT